MSSSMVLTLTGPDRVGVVESVTQALLALGGNVESSRMARLGGEFAILMLVSLPPARVTELDAAFGRLTAEGYKLTASATSAPADKFDGWLTYRVEVSGADHEGIIHDIATGLAARGITIESAETGLMPAATTGVMLFTMSALVLVPPQLHEEDWMSALAEAGADANVDIEVALAQ